MTQRGEDPVNGTAFSALVGSRVCPMPSLQRPWKDESPQGPLQYGSASHTRQPSNPSDLPMTLRWALPSAHLTCGEKQSWSGGHF